MTATTPLFPAPLSAETLAAIVRRHGEAPEATLGVLEEIQQRQGWVSPSTITAVAQALGLPRARVEGVVGFYSFLGERYSGAYRILFSDNITDRMLGSAELMRDMCRNLWVEPGKTSEEGLVSVDTTSCTGMCDQGPALLVNGRPLLRLDRERMLAMCERVRARVPVEAWPADWFAVQSCIRRTDRLLHMTVAPGEAIRRAIELGPEGVMSELAASRLRGRGGAGFPVASKWQACRQSPGHQRFVVCNADEGEPGTFKDRVLLTERADLVFEGMTLCAFAIGAGRGFLYVRGEYRYLLPQLEACLARRRETGLLGKGLLGRPGFDFDIEIRLGAGAYVCGEESALIESLEGKRGIPRNRPPFPVSHGYLGEPTVVNNVETLCAVTHVVHLGGAAYAGIGTEASSGTKLMSVSGDCARPGIYEYPFGVTVRQILEDCGASETLAVQVGGPSGVCIDETEFDRRIAFEDIPSAGAFMVFDARRDLFEVAHNFVRFFAHESCGFCTPCRVGTSLQLGLMDKIARGSGTQGDLAQLAQLDQTLQMAAHCGLGHTACNPVLDTLKRFRPAYERRLASLGFRPAFDLDGALAAARQMTGRDDAGAHLGSET